MRLLESLKNKKLILLNIFISLYIGINLIGGERGLISYFEKKNIYNELVQKELNLKSELNIMKHKIKLINNNDIDYLDILFREKMKFGAKNEILIKLR